MLWISYNEGHLNQHRGLETSWPIIVCQRSGHFSPNQPSNVLRFHGPYLLCLWSPPNSVYYLPLHHGVTEVDCKKDNIRKSYFYQVGNLYQSSKPSGLLNQSLGLSYKFPLVRLSQLYPIGQYTKSPMRIFKITVWYALIFIIVSIMVSWTF